MLHDVQGNSRADADSGFRGRSVREDLRIGVAVGDHLEVLDRLDGKPIANLCNDLVESDGEAECGGDGDAALGGLGRLAVAGLLGNGVAGKTGRPGELAKRRPGRYGLVGLRI